MVLKLSAANFYHQNGSVSVILVSQIESHLAGDGFYPLRPIPTASKTAIDAICYRISQLARTFGLSSSTLLYYDRIGLLRPSGRTTSNYRIHSNVDRQRFAQICRYRRKGMSLETIAEVLGSAAEKDGQRLGTAAGGIESRAP